MLKGNRLSLIRSVLGARFAGRPVPLIVGWSLTHRCNVRCLYCVAWAREREEMTTKECLDLLDEMAACGTVRIQFTGGEPLLRDDLGVLLDRCRSLGIFTTISTNGYLVRERLTDLEAAGMLNISLDGRKDNNDAVRGNGAFDKALEAVEAARDGRIPFKFITVLTRYNLGDIDFMITLARGHSTTVLFQPASEHLLRGRASNPIIPEVSGYRDTIERLIMYKKSGAPVVNSTSGLRHLWFWPGPRPIRCVGGSIFCRIWPDGELVSCPRQSDMGERGQDIREMGFHRAFKELKVTPCTSCWSAPVVEAGCALSFRPGALVNLLRSKLA